MAKRKNNTLLIVGLVVVLALLVGAAIYKSRSQPKGEKVTVEKVTRRTIQELVSASGKVFPHTEVKISSDVSGEIVELYVKEGDSVVVGQILARINPDVYQSQVEQSMASVNGAKAQLANVKSQVENLRSQREQILANLENARVVQKRNEKLFKNGVISEADYQTSLTSMKALEANLRASEASIRASEESANSSKFQIANSEAALKQVKTSLRRTTIYAPIGGVISLLNVEKGERVVGTIQMAGTEMMRIANLNNMEVRVDVSENDIPRVTLGDVVDIEVDAYLGRKFKGHVTEIANSASSSKTAAATLTSDQITNFEVRIRIDQGSYQDLISPEKRYPFRPGMSSSVDINTTTKSGILVIPIQSVTTRDLDEEKARLAAAKKAAAKKTTDDDATEEIDRKDQAEVVFVAMKGDTVRMVPIKTGIQDNTYIEILEGLKEGDEVVSGPYTVVSRKLKKGSKIQKVREDQLFTDKKKADK
jgi:HlyD family secretion protein